MSSIREGSEGRAMRRRAAQSRNQTPPPPPLAVSPAAAAWSCYSATRRRWRWTCRWREAAARQGGQEPPPSPLNALHTSPALRIPPVLVRRLQWHAQDLGGFLDSRDKPLLLPGPAAAAHGGGGDGLGAGPPADGTGRALYEGKQRVSVSTWLQEQAAKCLWRERALGAPCAQRNMQPVNRHPPTQLQALPLASVRHLQPPALLSPSLSINAAGGQGCWCL